MTYRKNPKVSVEAQDKSAATATTNDAATAKCPTTLSSSGSAAIMQPATATRSTKMEIINPNGRVAGKSIRVQIL